MRMFSWLIVFAILSSLLTDSALAPPPRYPVIDKYNEYFTRAGIEPPVVKSVFPILYGPWLPEYSTGKLTVQAAVSKLSPSTHEEFLIIYTWECAYKVHMTPKVTVMAAFANSNNSSYLARVLCSAVDTDAITKVTGQLLFTAGDLHFVLADIKVLRRDVQLA